jgi:hypothetical protein
MSVLPSPETCLAYADILEKPYRDVAGGIQHEPGEIAKAAAVALRVAGSAERYLNERNHYRSEWVRVGAERDALALQVLVLEQQRDEARAYGSST